MKKILALLVVLMTVAGCSASRSYSYLENGNEVLFKGPDNISYTRNDLYKSLKLSAGDIIIEDILKRIARQSTDIDIEAIEKEADELINSYISNDLEAYITASYGSVDAYRSAYISSAIMNALAELYATENYDGLIAERKPIKMQVASFAELENAEKCIADFNNAVTFDMAAANNSSVSTAQAQIYMDDDSTLDLEVKDYINSTDTTGISTIITHVTTSTDADGKEVETPSYYVLNIISRTPDEFKDEVITELAADVDQDTLTDYFLNKHEYSIYDQDLYEVLSTKNEVFK